MRLLLSSDAAGGGGSHATAIRRARIRGLPEMRPIGAWALTVVGNLDVFFQVPGRFIVRVDARVVWNR